MTARTAPASTDPRRPRSDEELYAAVIKAWCRTLTREESRRWPLSPYVFGRGFVRSIARSRVDGLQVAWACARLARKHAGQQERGEPFALEPTPREALHCIGGHVGRCSVGCVHEAFWSSAGSGKHLLCWAGRSF